MYVGETLVAKKQVKAGLARFGTALEGFERIAKQVGQNDDVSLGRAETLTGIGTVHQRKGECQLAVAFYDRSLNILSEIQRRGALVAQDQGVFHQTQDGKAACERVVADRGSHS